MERLTEGAGVAHLAGEPEPGWLHESWDEYASLSMEHIHPAGDPKSGKESGGSDAST